MARLPRGEIIDVSMPGIYHVYSRTVRRTFLFGEDVVTGKNYAHRLEKLRQTVQSLVRLFAIEVIGFGFMQNHYHEILRNRPDLVKRMSDAQVAMRWCLLNELGMKPPLDDAQRTPKQRAKLRRRVAALMEDAARMEHVRAALSSISVFEQRLKGTIARLANLEDGVSGHFWCGRFESNRIRTPESLLAAMIYVDLNPIRAGMAQTPEESRYTSAYERIHGLRARLQAHGEMGTELESVEKQAIAEAAATDDVRTLLDDWLCPIDERREGLPFPSIDSLETMIDEESELWLPLSETGDTAHASETTIASDSNDTVSQELLAIAALPSRASNKGCLPISLLDYLRVLDWSGRRLRDDKPGHIPPELPSILSRLGIADPEDWWRFLDDYTQRLAKRFSTPVNQLAEAMRTVVDTVTGRRAYVNALL